MPSTLPNVSGAVSPETRTKIEDVAPLASFPDDYIQVARLTAPNATKAGLIREYNQLLQAGNYTEATTFLANHTELNECRVTLDTYNRIVDEIKALEVFFDGDIQSFIEQIAQEEVGIDDSSASATNSYSSQKIESLIAQVSRQISKMNNIQTIKLAKDSDWTGSGPFTQTVSITGYQGDTVTANDRPEIYYNSQHVTSATDMESYAEQCGYISKIETAAGSLVATAFSKPTMDIYIDVKGV